MTLRMKATLVFVCLLSMALITTAAGTNLAVLGLLLVAPFAWRDFRTKNSLDVGSFTFLALIVAICVWDLTGNLIAGHDAFDAFKALLHDMRTLGFVVLLWAIFANPVVARAAFWMLLGSVVALAAINLLLTGLGYQKTDPYFWRSGSHLYGQVLVGMFFVLAQMLLVRPSLKWRVAVPMSILLLSLFFASVRRTGYLLLVAGFVVWALLNYKRLFVGRYKWAVLAALFVASLVAFASPIVQQRMAKVFLEINQYVALTPEQRAGIETSVGIRMQFYVSIAELIKNSNWWIGVGSIDFPNLFWEINEKMGTTREQAIVQFSSFQNPHNEYLFMLATKGLVGLALYLAIFVQACRVALQKTDEIQRISLMMFVFLFMVSITTNSMMTDMEEGHFTMLIFLIFLAPSSLGLLREEMTHTSKN